jgi:hypothetical protein
MKIGLPTRTIRIFSGLALFLLLSTLLVLGGKPVWSGPTALSATTSHLPAPLDGPIIPDPFVCDWQRPQGNGQVTVTVKFTRAMPQNGWLGTLHSDYPNATTGDQDFQIFNPRPLFNEPKDGTPKRQLGINWDFQTQDGKAKCQLFVADSKGQMRFSACSNGVEEYCLAESVTRVILKKNCPSCNSGGIYDQIACGNSCLAPKVPGGPLLSDPFCKNSKVSCFSTIAGTFKDGGFNPFDSTVLAGIAQDRADFDRGTWPTCGTNGTCPAGRVCRAGVCELNPKF